MAVIFVVSNRAVQSLLAFTFVYARVGIDEWHRVPPNIPNTSRVRQITTVRKRAMRQVREFVIKHTVGTAEATGKGIPIKRHQTYQYGL